MFARNFINFEHFVEASVEGFSTDSGAVCLNYTPGSVSKSSWNKPTTAEQLFFAVGSGSVEYEVSLPEGLSTADVAEIALIFEASSSYGGARQTEPEKYPSDVTISVNGAEIDTVHIPDCPADARGVLSYIHEQPGIYGYLYNIKIDPSLVLNGETDTLRICYEVKADAEAQGGFALYGARMGRYPTGPHLHIRRK